MNRVTLFSPPLSPPGSEELLDWNPQPPICCKVFYHCAIGAKHQCFI